jgi:CubicO group peptidase (beta-lactamase class C family)
MIRIILFVCLIVANSTFAQSQKSLPRSTPSAEGVSAQAIQQFLDAAAASKHEFHSMMILRNGRVIAEGWWDPYKPELVHTMYSVSKSYTATAIGFAVTEQRLAVSDKVLDFFPAYKDGASDFQRQLEIKDLLTMSVGHEKSFNFEIFPKDDWTKAFMAMPIANEPGTKFLYNTSASYILSAIIRQVTDQNLTEYLTPRLFEPLGITGIDWETDPDGVDTGGWGLRLKTEDMAKFGLLFLQKGQWEGEQLLPESWIEAASTVKIMQEPEADATKLANNDWIQGYAYQMWRSRHNSYRADGAYGQYILVLPEVQGVIIFTSETNDLQGILNLAWQHLLPAFKGASDDDLQLKNRLLNLSISPQNGTIQKQAEKKYSGKTFQAESANNKVKSLQVKFKKGTCMLTLDSKYLFTLGEGEWISGTTRRKGPNLFDFAQNYLEGLPPFQVSGSYGWEDANTLNLALKYTESPHTEHIQLKFTATGLSATFKNSHEQADKKKEVKLSLK